MSPFNMSNDTKTAANAAQATSVPMEAKKVLTSEKLENLKSQQVQDAINVGLNPTDKSYLDKLFATLASIKNEEKSLNDEALKQVAAEARSRRLALKEVFRDAVIAEHTAHSKKIKGEELDAIVAKRQEAEVALDNQLLGSLASTKVKTEGTATGTPKEGSKSGYCREYFIKRTSEGATKPEIEKELREKGYNDGTVNNAINDYLKSTGQK